jgi:hypothetical protein
MRMADDALQNIHVENESPKGLFPLDVKLSDREVKDALLAATAGTAISAGLGVVGLGKIIEWKERLDQALRDQQLNKTLQQFVQRFSSVDDAVARLQILTGTREGQILFRKVIQILEGGESDPDWTALLANILKNVSDEKIVAQFRQYEFLLSQIDKLSPQSLVVLSKYQLWNMATISGTSTTSKHTVAGDWDSQISNFLARQIGTTDSSVILRIGHTFKELESAGMVFLSGSQVKLTIMGAEIYRVIGT